jgi:HAMP domain-containing protein
VSWVVITDAPLDDVRQPLWDYVGRIVVVLVIVVPLSALVGLWLARRLTKPIGPALDAARAITEGERDPQLPTRGRDEFGDLARRLNAMAADLGRQEEALAAEYENTRQLLLAVLPPHLVEGGAVTGTGDIAELATVVAVGIDRHDAAVGDDFETHEAVAQLQTRIEQIASDLDVQRIRIAADRSLFLAGARHDDNGADDALAFATALAGAAADVRVAHDVDLELHVGISTGPVATGVLERGSLTFGAWGEPVRRALAIGALSISDEVLVDSSTVAVADTERWNLRQAVDVVDLDGEAMDLSSLLVAEADRPI